MTKKRKGHAGRSLTLIARTGNFIVRKRGDGQNSFVRISACDGAWSMEFRDDTLKYAWVMMLASEEKYHRVLEAWIVITYHVAGCFPDPEFLDGVMAQLQALGQRVAESDAGTYAERRRKAAESLDDDIELETIREETENSAPVLENTEE